MIYFIAIYLYVPDDYLKIYRQANPPFTSWNFGTAPSVGYTYLNNVNNTCQYNKLM